MAKVCQICGKGPGFGKNVSHSHRRTLRRFEANLQKIKALIDNKPQSVNVCTKCLKAGKIVKA